MYNPDAGAEISAHVGIQEGATIKASLLIGDNSTFTDFNDSFMYWLEYYASGSTQEPDQESHKPEIPLEPDPPFMPLTIQEIMDAFLDAILVENCVELYFPKAMNFGVGFNLTSLAHPLTDANTNEASVRYYYPQGGDIVIDEQGNTTYENQYITEGIVLNQNYVNTHNNIIIARPIRESIVPGRHCAYDDYSGIDFEDFMD
jgi:hypothetical protein